MRSKNHIPLFISILLILILVGLVISSNLKQHLVQEDTRSYEQIVQEDSPREALAKLRLDITKNSEVSDACHPIAHEIGRLGYEKYHSYEKAAEYQDAVCNSGYIHGVLERRLAGAKNLSEELGSLCKGPFQTGFSEWQCFHGIGHGIMYYTNNNLPLSLQYCLSLPEPWHQQNCANGIYMENFVSDNNLHPSQFVKDTEPFYPCTDSGMPFTDDCIYYAPTRILKLNQNNYMDAYKQCDSLSVEDRTICVRGVSGQATKDNFSNPKEVENLCSRFSDQDRTVCVQSMLSMYVNMDGGVENADEVCFSLEYENMPVCFAELEQKKSEHVRKVQ